VKSVQAFKGKAMWDALDAIPHGKECLEAGLKLVPAHSRGDLRAITAKTEDAAIFVIEYNDGLKAALAVLNGWLYEGDGGAFIFAGKEKGKKAPHACHFYLQQPDPFAHFAEQVKAIERMAQANHAPWPVERTLLTSGILDAAMTSLAEKTRKVETPHLAIKYKAADYPFATGPVPKGIKR
jgi:hypothetical protein